MKSEIVHFIIHYIIVTADLFIDYICQNHGKCTVTLGRYQPRCECTLEYTGEKCEIQISKWYLFDLYFYITCNILWYIMLYCVIPSTVFYFTDYIIMDNKFCFNPQQESEYLSLMDAKNACSLDRYCGMFYDVASRNEKSVLCGNREPIGRIGSSTFLGSRL